MREGKAGQQLITGGFQLFFGGVVGHHVVLVGPMGRGIQVGHRGVVDHVERFRSVDNMLQRERIEDIDTDPTGLALWVKK